jgi:hypothetical protein
MNQQHETAARQKGVDPYESGGLTAWGGIVSGHLSDWADAFGCTPADVLEAARQVPVMNDTGKPKGGGKDRDRPADPELRSLTLTRGNADRLRALCENDTL